MRDRKFMDVGRVGVVVAFGSVVAAIAGEPALPPVESPVENAPNESKRVLGKMLFFEEQLSSDNTVACATCHVMARGGTDPRRGIAPGRDLAFGNDSDVFGSPGIRPLATDGSFDTGSVFGLDRQVTGRTTPSVFGASYADAVLWDGRAGGRFVDPVTEEVVVQEGGALESQALLPLVNTAEMGHIDRTFPEILSKLASVTPLALADRLPEDVAQALYGNPSYPELFRRAFGDAEITAARVAMAISAFERTLAPNQTDYDRFIAGDTAALTEREQRGLEAFNTVGCAECHPAPLFTDNSFRATGVRPHREDGGVGDISQQGDDSGKFKVPSLRNVALKRSFFHDGRRSTLHEAVKFYQRSANQTSQPKPGGGPVFAFDDTADFDPAVGAPVNSTGGFGLPGKPQVIDGGPDFVADEPTADYGGSNHQPHEVQFIDNQDPAMAQIRMNDQQMADIEAFLEGGLVDTRVQDEVAPFDRPLLASENPDLAVDVTGTGRGGAGVVPEIVVSAPALEGTTEFPVGIAGAPPDTGARLIMWEGDSPVPSNPVVTPTVVLEPSVSAGGTATVFPDISGFDPGTQLNFVWQVDDPRAPGGVANSRVAEVTVFEQRSVEAPLAGAKRPRLDPPAVDDRDAFVARATFRVDWAAHRRDDARDEFAFTGRINPRGIGADLSQGRLHAAVNGVTVIDGVALDADGLVRSPGLDATYDREDGSLSIALRGLDLSVALEATKHGRGRIAVPLVVTLTGLGLTDPTVATDVQFNVRSRGGDVATGKFDFAKFGTDRGTFQVRSIAALPTQGGVRVKVLAMLDAPGDGRIDVSEGLVLEIGSSSKFVVHSTMLAVSRKGLVSASGPGALRSLRIDPRTKTLSFDVVVNDPLTTGIPFGTIVQLPIRLDTAPATDGPEGVFETVAEIRID